MSLWPQVHVLHACLTYLVAADVAVMQTRLVYLYYLLETRGISTGTSRIASLTICTAGAFPLLVHGFKGYYQFPLVL